MVDEGPSSNWRMTEEYVRLAKKGKGKREKGVLTNDESSLNINASMLRPCGLKKSKKRPNNLDNEIKKE